MLGMAGQEAALKTKSASKHQPCTRVLCPLCYAEVQVSDDGLASLHGLTRLTSLGLGGLGASDTAVAGLLRLLPALRVLCLERCSCAGDGALEALTETVRGAARAGAVPACLKALRTQE